MSKSFELLRLLKGGLRSHDIHQIIQTLLRLECGLEPGKFCIPEAVLVKLCKASGPALVKEPNLLRLEAREYVIVGDVHGQFEDLQRIFFKYGMPPRTSYIFLGDMVDRGDRSLEVMTLLLALKLEHPDHIFLLRGNHETAEVTHHFGFREECDSRSGPTTWKHFVSVFDALPLAAHIAEPANVYCAHGGISPYMIKMEQLDKAVQRPAQINSSTSPIVIDTLWADPSEHIDMWGPSSRGLSHQFGLRAARMFMKANGLKRIIRGHSAQNSGYNILGNDEVITVFSSPNYCNSGNDGAVMVLGSDGNFAIDLLRMDSLDSKMKWSSDELLRTDILIE